MEKKIKKWKSKYAKIRRDRIEVGEYIAVGECSRFYMVFIHGPFFPSTRMR